MIPIATPPWKQCGKKIESAMRKALYDFAIIEGIDSIAVALSGGKDSMTLLYMLKAIAGRGFPDIKIHAIYVAGEYSCGAGVDENMLRAVCRELDVNFIVCHSTQTLENLECYRCSRERRSLIFDAAKEAGTTTIAFGHHRDDNIQTTMMNMLHKGEFAGNLPKLLMKKYGVTIVRPLIYVAENDIKTFAKQHGFNRITCQCPVGQNSLRKKVDDIITDIEDTFPNARKNIAHAVQTYGSSKAL
jgi:tRNA 2-thiocytidine biosynthesis protein TtcA